MSGLRFNLHRDALGRVPPPKHNRPNGRHAATPLQEGLQNAGEKVSPEPEAEAEGRSDARLHPDILPVWDAVCANHRHVFDHLTGEALRSDVGLKTVIRAFHTEAVRLQCPVRLDLLLGVFACCPQGPFAQSVGTEPFAKEIGDLWQLCIDELHAEKTKAAKEPPPVLQLRFGIEATEPQSLGTIVEGLLHAGSVTLIYGPPKSGKSFLATDLALAVADDKADEWMGHKIVRHGPILYVACEGHAGFWKRAEAAKRERERHGGVFPPGFILATGRPTLIRVDEGGMHYAPDPSAILTALQTAKRRGMNPVAIVVDTVFRSFGAGNVNASPDMNVYLAAVAVLTDEGYALALVHHEIKSGGTPAGSVSLIGGSDTIIHVWRENEIGERRIWQVEMAKDDAETGPRAFTLKVVPAGQDPDSKRPVSSCVICDEGAAPDATAKKKRGRPPAEDSDTAILAELIYRELCNLLADPREGEDVSIHPEAPPIRAVSRSRLRGAINQAGIIDPVEDEAERQRVTEANRRDVNRAINRLKKQRKVAANEQWVGLGKVGGSINQNL